MKSSSSGLNLQLLNYKRLQCPFILWEDSPTNGLVGSLHNGIFSKIELALITKVASFLEIKGDQVDQSEKIQGSNIKAFGLRRSMGDTGW